MVQKALPEPLQACNRSRGKGSGWSSVFPVTVLGGNPWRGQGKSHFPSYLFQPSSTLQYPLHLADGTSSDLHNPQMRCSPEQRSKAEEKPQEQKPRAETAGTGTALPPGPAGAADPMRFCCCERVVLRSLPRPLCRRAPPVPARQLSQQCCFCFEGHKQEEAELPNAAVELASGCVSSGMVSPEPACPGSATQAGQRELLKLPSPPLAAQFVPSQRLCPHLQGAAKALSHPLSCLKSEGSSNAEEQAGSPACRLLAAVPGHCWIHRSPTL